MEYIWIRCTFATALCSTFGSDVVLIQCWYSVMEYIWIRLLLGQCYEVHMDQMYSVMSLYSYTLYLTRPHPSKVPLENPPLIPSPPPPEALSEAIPPPPRETNKSPEAAGAPGCRRRPDRRAGS